ncbi:predicted protein [Chaetomium globosum CBS 148.51]|uniref:Uncharacterized protein n=1 Tax=Chaetomium globosum (strain ATCC 6205 / CBS 148.51 / DSM 1962 / NBRC 6347 / NRRL 1970) TaxID=306901 RepID=Q2HHB1_CHAGB|nr:uncharacterized protein CHGG_00393 [Chaetomium globosum CBS 148.51]EAQ92158.1 predicted protein [Chaetomium globosum CBS 148.51]
MLPAGRRFVIGAGWYGGVQRLMEHPLVVDTPTACCGMGRDGGEGPAGRLRLPILRALTTNTAFEWTQDLAGTGPVPPVCEIFCQTLAIRLRPVVEDWASTR